MTYNLEVLGVINHDIDSKFIHVSFSDTYEIEDFIRGVVGVRKDAIFRLIHTKTDKIKKIWRLVDGILVEIAEYMLEICHPNEDNWKFITTFDSLDQLRDNLASPTFEVTQSLLVRCRNCQSRDFYLGCFSHGKFVSIDSESNVMQKIRRHSGARIESHENVISFWRQSKSPNTMLSAIEHSVPLEDKRRIGRSLMSLVEQYIPISLKNILDSAPVENQAAYIAQAINENNGAVRRSIEALQAYWILSFTVTINSAFPNIGYYVEECLRSANNASVKRELSDFIRAQIPLHLMLEWVTRK